MTCGCRDAQSPGGAGARSGRSVGEHVPQPQDISRSGVTCGLQLLQRQELLQLKKLNDSTPFFFDTLKPKALGVEYSKIELKLAASLL